MPKLTIEDLKRIKGEHQAMLNLREGGYRAKVTVHMGTCGIASGARKVMEAFLDEIKRNNVADIIVTTSGCAGLCSQEPMTTVELLNQAPVKYIQLDEEKTRRIFREHLMEGKIVEQYALAMGSESEY
jgi:NADP-reducing hydrogenase subunit HndB